MRKIKNPYIDYDKYGHCVLCHDTLISKNVIEGKLQERASPKLDEVQFVLSDGSKMRVCMCRSCKHDLKEDDYSDIMTCVYNGWKKEAEGLSWTTSQRVVYLENCAKKRIVRIA